MHRFFRTRDTNKVLVTPYTKFSLKLIQELAEQASGRNIVASPMSAAMVLAMAYNGAGGATQQAIAQVLELDGIRLDTLNAANAALLAALGRLDPQITLTLNNRLGVPQAEAVRAAFLETNQQHYKAEITTGSEGSLILANRIHFKGAWSEPFDSKLTSECLFVLPDGASKYCSMMGSPRQSWGYYQHGQFELVRLPYGAGRASLYILLPDKSIPLTEVLKELTFNNWGKWLGRLADKEGDILLPRFVIDDELPLDRVLKTLGMGIVFDPEQADFSAMCDIPAWVGEVKQQARIEVNEEGTEAAAETLMSIALGGEAFGAPRFRMIVDHPFLYAIRDDQTGMLLFMGIVVDPDPSVPAAKWELTGVKAENRAKVISLVYALETMKAAFEEGLFFDAAMGKVYEYYEGDLALNIGRYLREMQLGKPRHQGLKETAERAGEPETRLFFEDAIRAEQTNESVYEVVKAHLERLRAKYSRPGDSGNT